MTTVSSLKLNLGLDASPFKAEMEKVRKEALRGLSTDFDIKAQLDTADIQRQIRSVQSQAINVAVKVDTADLQRQINVAKLERSLSKQKAAREYSRTAQAHLADSARYSKPPILSRGFCVGVTFLISLFF